MTYATLVLDVGAFFYQQLDLVIYGCFVEIGAVRRQHQGSFVSLQGKQTLPDINKVERR